MITKYSSGNSCQIRKIQVNFHEYKNISSLCREDVPDTLVLRLREFSAESLNVNYSEAPFPVSGKWVYVFTRVDQKIRIIYEIKVKTDGGNQSFQFVSWNEADRKANLDKYPRPLTLNSDRFFLDAGFEYHIVLSQIQLPLHRIDFYIKNPTQLTARSLHIPAELPVFDQPLVKVCLVDYIAITENLSDEYAKAVDQFETFAQDPKEVNKRYLANLVCMIQKSRPKIADWLDFGKVAAYNNDQTRLLKHKENVLKNCEGRLGSWKLKLGYALTRDDYNGTKEIEELIIKHEEAVTSLQEVKYLAKVAEDKDSWYNRVFLNPDPFRFHRKLDKLMTDKVFVQLMSKYFIGRLLSALPKYAPTANLKIEVIYEIQMKIIKEYSALLTRSNLVIPELVQKDGQFFFMAKDEWTHQPRVRYEFSAQIKSATSSVEIDDSNYANAMKRWEDQLKKVSSICKVILLPMEVFNFSVAYQAAISAATTKERWFGGITAFGAFSSSLGAVRVLAEEQLKSKSAAITAKYGEDVAKYAEKSLSKIGGFLSLTSAVCDYIGYTRKTIKASSEGKTGLTIGNALIALSAVSSAAAASATLTGVAVFGLGAGPLGLIAIGLFVIGAGVVWAFTDDPLEVWAKSCMWGKKYAGSSVEQQIHKLHEVLSEFQLHCYLYAQQRTQYASANGFYWDYDYYFTIRIKPGMMNEGASKYNVTVNISQDGGWLGSDKSVLQKSLILPDTKTEIHRNGENGPIEMIIRRFNVEELGLDDRVKNTPYKFTMTGQLDLEGNSTHLIPQQPLLRDGELKLVGMDGQI
jgi:hypothetical protein